MELETRPSARRRTATQLDRELAEGTAAVQLVASGQAVRVHLANFRYGERIGASLLPVARSAGVSLQIERGQSGAALIIGPRRQQPVPSRDDG